MRTNKVIDATEDSVFEARRTATELVGDISAKKTIDELYNSTSLEAIEAGIRNLNDMANKSWILSAILVYTLVYDRQLYKQSGLMWNEYSMRARERLGLDPRDISEQLSAARFFIQHHEAMKRKGWTPKEANRKLARAEMALELTKDIDAVLDHLAHDSWSEFNGWYQSFKPARTLDRPKSEIVRKDITFKKGKPCIGGVEAVKISTEIPEHDQERLAKYMTQIFEALRGGYEPAIVPVYDEKEAAMLPRLRDKYRQKK